MLTLIVLSIYCTSCKKHLGNDCDTCETVEPQAQVMRSDFGYQFQYNVYTDFGDTSSEIVDFVYADISNEKIIGDIILQTNNDILMNALNNTNPVSLTIYTSRRFDSTLSIDSNTTKGYLLYYYQNDKLLTLVINMKNGNHIDSVLTTTANYISSNDIMGIAKNAFDTTIRSSISYVIMGDAKLVSNSISNFHTNLEFYHYLTMGIPFEPASPEEKKCYYPCPTDKGVCLAHEGQNGPADWTCWSNCFEERSVHKLKDSSINLYDYTVHLNKLRSFKNSYLYKSEKGLYFIKLYRYLSLYFQNSSLSIDYCVHSANIINNEILPIIDLLMTNPDSGQIAYDNEHKNKMVAFLEESKNHFSDTYAIAKIDELITLINNNVNKPVYAINEYIKN